VSLAIACLMPFVMLALMFFLADIEKRHLTQRPRVDVAPAEVDGQA
jgi:hypothetical protein